MALSEAEELELLELKRKREGNYQSPTISGTPPFNPKLQGPNLAAEDVLPLAGGIAGSLIGGAAGIPEIPFTAGTSVPIGSTIGAAEFGALGETGRQYIRALRGKSTPATPMEALKQSGIEGAKQGAAELVGQSLIPAAKFVGRRIGDISGIMTGAGGAVKEAAEAGLKGVEAQKALINGMRGDISEKQIANDAIDSLNAIRRNRGNIYTKQMEKIQSSSFQKNIDLKSIKTELDDLFDSYNIKRASSGELDFSRAALDDPSIADVKRIAELVDNWGSQPGDNTVKGLDILKRRIDDFFSPSSEARTFVSSLRNKVKNTIVDAAPEYEKLTSGYQKTTNLIHDINSELSLGSNAKAGTIVRKLKQSLRQNFDLRKEFVETLDKFGKKNVLEQVAGAELSSVAPKGLMRAVAGADILGAVHDPRVLLGLPFTSPRLAGEAALKTGQTARLLSPLAPAVPQATQIGIGARRLLYPPFFDENQ